MSSGQPIGTQSNIPNVLDVSSVVRMVEASSDDVVGNITVEDGIGEESAGNLLEVDVGAELVGGREVGDSGEEVSSEMDVPRVVDGGAEVGSTEVGSIEVGSAEVVGGTSMVVVVS